MLTTTSPALQVPLPKADAEYISECEELLYEDFWLNSFRRPYFKFPSTAHFEASKDGLPLLHFRWSGEDPDTAYSLSTGVPHHLLKKFINKDIVLYVRPKGQGDILRDLFMAWYPHRPPLPTQITAVPAINIKDLPTDADAYSAVRQGFCVAMDYIALDDGPEGFPLSKLIRYHNALVHLIKAEMDEIVVPEMDCYWYEALMGLGGGFGDGFCIYEGPGVIELRVVGRESWIQRGWGIDCMFDTQSWDEVDGVRDEAVNEKWWTCTMPLQDAVDGVIRASGEEGRFDEKPVSEYFRDEFLHPEQLSEEEIQDLLRLNEEDLKLLRGTRGQEERDRAEASNKSTQESDQTLQ